jgi:nucleoid-associated protein YgaU
VSARKDFAMSLPGDPMAEAGQRRQLLETLRAQQEENTALKSELAGLREQLRQREDELADAAERLAEVRQRMERQGGEVAPIVIRQPVEPRAGSAAARPSTYTVETGDTLSRISQKVYGTSGRWTEIFEANRDQLPSPNALRVGQVLRIP